MTKPHDRPALLFKRGLMMSTRTALLLALIVATSSTAYAKRNAAGAPEARAAIEAANAEFSEAFARGDSKALAALYTSDAIVFPPDSEMIHGNAAIGNF